MRDDLQAIPVMEAGGWNTMYSPADMRWGRTDITDKALIPHDTVRFEKDGAIVEKRYKFAPGTEEHGDEWWEYFVTGQPGSGRKITIEEAAKL